MSKRAGIRWGIGAGVLAMLIATGLWGGARRHANSPRDSFRRVTVSRQALHLTKTATGQVTPQNRVEVKPPIAGRIEQVLVQEGEAVAQGQVLAWMSSDERAALLDAARSQGPEALARWESVYKPAPLMAPLDGTVIVRAVEPGQTVTTGDPIVVVADRLIVKAQVDETDLGAIAVGQPASITLDAFPHDTVTARVDHIAYEAKTVNNVTIYDVDVRPESVPAFMRSGMTATVTFIVASAPDALVVPAEAVRQEAEACSVLMPSSKGRERPSRKTITTGLSDGKWIEVTAGLQEGDAVLVPSLKMPRAGGGPRGNPFSPFGGSRSRQSRGRS